LVLLPPGRAGVGAVVVVEVVVVEAVAVGVVAVVVAVVAVVVAVVVGAVVVVTHRHLPRLPHRLRLLLREVRPGRRSATLGPGASPCGRTKLRGVGLDLSTSLRRCSPHPPPLRLDSTGTTCRYSLAVA
ncbi:unnamed protein product, partial [Urochloa humidicola]